MAKGFKTGGRQKGTPNRATSEMRRAIAESGETPVEYMVRIMRDETAEPSRRDDMARAAAPYLHPRLSAVSHNDETNKQFVVEIPAPCETIEEWEAMVQKRLQRERLSPVPHKVNDSL